MSEVLLSTPRLPSASSLNSDESSLRSDGSPVDAKASWTPNGTMITLSPPAGDQNTHVSSEPMQSSSGRMEEAMDQIPSGSSDEVEGVWSQDIETAFREAMTIYPPCGRRKIILSDEGKMYGRNELIARYIKIRTGKTRTRKQVSSHIQVLMRKQQREHTGASKDGKSASPSSSLAKMQQEYKAMASTVLSDPLPATVTPPGTAAPPLQIKEEAPLDKFNLTLAGKTTSLFSGYPFLSGYPAPFGFDLKPPLTGYENQAPLLAFIAGSPKKELVPPSVSIPSNGLLETTAHHSPTECYRIETASLSLCAFNAYVDIPGVGQTDIVTIPPSEQKFEEISFYRFTDKYPKELFDLYQKGPRDAFFLVKCWANIGYNLDDRPEGINEEEFFGVDSLYESEKNIKIKVNTTLCSYQKNAVQKVEDYSPSLSASGKYMFDIKRSPFCEYMIKFLDRIKVVPHEQQMRVLDNFTGYQIVTNSLTGEVLLVIAFIFDISTESEAGCSIFRIVDPL